MAAFRCVLLALIFAVVQSATKMTVVTTLQAKPEVDPVLLPHSVLDALFSAMKDAFSTGASIKAEQVMISQYWFNRRLDSADSGPLSLQGEEPVASASASFGTRRLRKGGALRLTVELTTDLSSAAMLSGTLAAMRKAVKETGSPLRDFNFVHFRVVSGATPSTGDDKSRPAGYKGSSGTEVTADLSSSSDQVAKGFIIAASVGGGLFVLFAIGLVFVLTRRYYKHQRNAEVIDTHASRKDGSEGPALQHELNPLNNPPSDEKVVADADVIVEDSEAVPAKASLADVVTDGPVAVSVDRGE